MSVPEVFKEKMSAFVALCPRLDLLEGDSKGVREVIVPHFPDTRGMSPGLLCLPEFLHDLRITEAEEVLFGGKGMASEIVV